MWVPRLPALIVFFWKLSAALAMRVSTVAPPSKATKMLPWPVPVRQKTSKLSTLPSGVKVPRCPPEPVLETCHIGPPTEMCGLPLQAPCSDQRTS